MTPVPPQSRPEAPALTSSSPSSPEQRYLAQGFVVALPPGRGTGVFNRRVDWPRLRRLPLDILDYSLFLPGICLVCALAISLRLVGPFFVVMPVGACLLYAVMRGRVPPPFLSLYLVFCLFMAVLSAHQVLPNSWQIYFREDAIVRQLIPLFGYFAVAYASRVYFERRLLNGDPFAGAPLFLFLGLVIGPAVMFQQGLRYQGEDTSHAILALYGAFINNVLIAMFFILGAVFFSPGWRRYAGLVAILAIAATTHFVQFRVLAIALIVTLLGVPGRAVAIVVVIALLATYAIGMNHIGEIMAASPNSGIRLAFVFDAITSAIDTDGAGIGYGKESVRWRYEYPDMPVFTFLPDPRSITPERMLEVLSTGVENSFAESLLRNGLMGFVLFVVAFFAGFPPRNLPRNVRNHASIVFAMTFIGCFVNSALESPNSAVGHAFVYGYLLALRPYARWRASAAVAAPVSSARSGLSPVPHGSPIFVAGRMRCLRLTSGTPKEPTQGPA